MTELDASSDRNVVDHNVGKISLLRRQLPFLAILALAIGGVAYTNISQRPLVGYWEFLAIVMGIVCVVSQWSELEDKDSRFRLMWTQALHWLAVLVTMNIMLLGGVQQLLPTLAPVSSFSYCWLWEHSSPEFTCGRCRSAFSELRWRWQFRRFRGSSNPRCSLFWLRCSSSGSPWRSGHIGAIRIR